MTAIITALVSSAGALVLQKKGCQTSRHLAAAHRASQRQLLDVEDGPNGVGGWENRKRLRRNAEMRRRREEKREARRVSGGGEKKPRRPTALNDGFRHRKSPGNKQNPTKTILRPNKKPCQSPGARYWPRARSSPFSLPVMRTISMIVHPDPFHRSGCRANCWSTGR
jgi:hypothetical protein